MSKRILTHDGEGIPLRPKPTGLLLVLVKHAGHLVEKDDTFVEEVNRSQTSSPCASSSTTAPAQHTTRPSPAAATTLKLTISNRISGTVVTAERCRDQEGAELALLIMFGS